VSIEKERSVGSSGKEEGREEIVPKKLCKNYTICDLGEALARKMQKAHPEGDVSIGV
jgi:hypothetical protein